MKQQNLIRDEKSLPNQAPVIFSALLYPVSLFGSIMLAFGLLEMGFHPTLAVLLPILLTTPFLLLAEMQWPASGSSTLKLSQVKVDLLHTVLWHGILPAALRAGVAGSCFAAGSYVSKITGLALWPANWPLAIQLFLALGVGEFLAYWIHRMGHETTLGWRFHALHHSPSELNALSAGRNHPINVTASYLGQLIPLLFLGVPTEVLALHAVFTGVNGPLQHVNLPFRTGLLNWICSTPELHHWHHSKTIEESNSNYGSNLILWDIVFGTRFLPKDEKRPERMGLHYPFPADFWGQLSWAFGPLPTESNPEKEKVLTICIESAPRSTTPVQVEHAA